MAVLQRANSTIQSRGQCNAALVHVQSIADLGHRRFQHRDPSLFCKAAFYSHPRVVPRDSKKGLIGVLEIGKMA